MVFTATLMPLASLKLTKKVVPVGFAIGVMSPSIQPSGKCRIRLRALSRATGGRASSGSLSAIMSLVMACHKDQDQKLLHGEPPPEAALCTTARKTTSLTDHPLRQHGAAPGAPVATLAQLKLPHPLDPITARSGRHDAAQRKAMRGGQRLIFPLVGEEVIGDL
jgi:hypothetical protein